jgi:WD40 repeat protein
VQLWDIDQREPLKTLADHYGEVCSIAFSGDGRYLAATSRSSGDSPTGWIGDLKVWNVSTGEMTLDIPSHTTSEAGIAFHPRRAWIASTGSDGTLELFNAETGSLLMSWPTFGYGCHTMDFSPDGERLLAPLSGTAKIIDPTPEERRFGGSAVHGNQPQSNDVLPIPVSPVPGASPGV